MKIQQPRVGILDQGTIFTCAKADRYAAKSVYGLAITARCDVAQDKFPVLNYLPVVALDDWLCVDGCEILRTRAVAETEGRLRQAMSAANIAASIRNSLSTRQIHEEFFVKLGKAAKVSDAFLELVAADEAVAGFQEPGVDAARRFSALFPKLRRAMLRELVLQRLTGYYFLPDATEGGDSSGWVVLLREPSYLPRVLSKLVAQGVDKSEGVIKTADPLQRYLSFEPETFAMPIGQIPSPDIEHILQCFSTLFGRIGLADPKDSYVDQISSREPPKVAP